MPRMSRFVHQSTYATSWWQWTSQGPPRTETAEDAHPRIPCHVLAAAASACGIVRRAWLLDAQALRAAVVAPQHQLLQSALVRTSPQAWIQNAPVDTRTWSVVAVGHASTSVKRHLQVVSREVRFLLELAPPGQGTARHVATPAGSWGIRSHLALAPALRPTLSECTAGILQLHVATLSRMVLSLRQLPGCDGGSGATSSCAAESKDLKGRNHSNLLMSFLAAWYGAVRNGAACEWAARPELSRGRVWDSCATAADRYPTTAVAHF
jgi:hypothetical protein